MIALATKPEDPTAKRFVELGYRVQEHLDIPTVETDGGRMVPHPRFRRVLLWPRQEQDAKTGRWRSMEAMAVYQQSAIRDALEYARRSRRWTIFTDDVLYLVDDLQLGQKLKWFWRQGRSAKLTLVAASQRPAWVPRDMYSAPEHLFFWKTNDKDDLDRLTDIGAGIDKKELAAVITSLERYEFLYLAPREHPPLMLRSKVDL